MKVLTILMILLPQTLGNFYFDNTNISSNEISHENIWKQVVTLTIYKPTSVETDSTPNVTASGFKIDTLNPTKHRIVAVSRDLKRKGWGFGKKIRIKKAGKYNGVYTIRDVMNKRHKNRIDVLVGEDYLLTKLENVEITLID